MGNELTSKDLHYFLVENRKLGIPAKLHQLRSSCDQVPNWNWMTRCGMLVSETKATAKVCSATEALNHNNFGPCLLCAPDCMNELI